MDNSKTVTKTYSKAEVSTCVWKFLTCVIPLIHYKLGVFFPFELLTDYCVCPKASGKQGQDFFIWAQIGDHRCHRYWWHSSIIHHPSVVFLRHLLLSSWYLIIVPSDSVLSQRPCFVLRVPLLLEILGYICSWCKLSWFYWNQWNCDNLYRLRICPRSVRRKLKPLTICGH